MEARLSENATENFYDRLPDINLLTFCSMKQSKKFKVSGKKSYFESWLKLINFSVKKAEYERSFTILTGTLSKGFSKLRGLSEKNQQSSIGE